MRFVCALLVSLVASAASAQTPFPARFVEAGRTVVVPKGNYTLSQQVVVRAGGKLVIDAGVNVAVAGLGVPIIVSGAVEFNGTAAEPITVSPDASGSCGTLQAYSVAGSRPSVSASFVDWTTTKNSTAFFLSACDFAITNSKITSKASAAATRCCVALAGGSTGVLSNCLLDGAGDLLAKPSVGLSVGNGTSQAEAVQLIETLIINATDPIKIKKQFALVNGSIE